MLAFLAMVFMVFRSGRRTGLVAGALAAGTLVGGFYVGGRLAGEELTDTTEQVQMTFQPITAIGEASADDWAPSYQGTGPHTMAGAPVYFAANDAVYFTTNDEGPVPTAAGTMHRVNLTGAGPWTAVQVAAAAEAVIDAAGSTVVDNLDGTLTVDVPSSSAVVSAQDGLTDYDGRGGGRVIGAQQNAAGSSTASNTTGWIQVLPADVPSGAFRVVAIEILRGNNVTNGVRVGFGDGGTADGNPQGLVVDYERTMGNSGTATWHREWLDYDEVQEYSGGERMWIGLHGDGSSSSVFGGGAINDGTYQDGSTNLWLTDGTSGSTTPFVSPAGAVTSSFNFGIAVRLVIQVAPYQEDGDYTVVNVREGVHDQDLFPSGSEIEDIFVAWGLETPTLQGLQVKRTRVNFRTHGGSGDTKRFELWNATGGSATFVGDTLIGLLGQTSASTPAGWSDLGHTAFDITPGADIRYTVKGTTSTGTLFELDLGGFGVGAANHPVYALQGGALEDEELEVLASNGETALDFDPSTATASPNNANSPITTPGNVGMISLHMGPPAPTVTAL